MRYDALVVGAGPAGSSTAFQLAKRGLKVRVLDRARFPRAKPCAECLSPQASRVLDDMGALRSLDGRGAWLDGMTVRAPNGIIARGDYAASHGFRAYRDGGLAIRRETLDDVLQHCARDAGAEVSEGVRVVDVMRGSDSAVTGVITLADDGTRHELRAAMVVGADGLRSIVARRLGLARTLRWPSRLALVGHFRDVRAVTKQVELHVERDGFVGIADIGAGVTTVAAVFPRRRAREIAADKESFLRRWLASKPQLAPRFERAVLEGQVSAVGPFASHARSARHPAGGAILVGDAADFFDPFTGEGIYAALRGGELAAAAVAEALSASRPTLDAYDDARRREFGGKWWVERLIGAGVASATLANRAIGVLAARKDLADLLVGVTGDFIPPREVLRIGYLARLFILPAPSTPSASAWR